MDPESQSTPSVVCSLCGKGEGQVPFSKRQRNKARSNEPAKCTSCIEAAGLHQPIPKKRKLNEGRLFEDEASSGEEAEESLDAIKRQVLGRDLHVASPVGKSEQEPDEDLAHIRELMEATPESNSKGSSSSVAARLQSDLQCAICHDLLYPPVSLHCGHSFCQDCLEWWWNNSQTCPSCRDPTSHGIALPRVNVALKRCIMALYAPLVAKKIQATKNVTAGEEGGRHLRGNEVLSTLQDEFWHSVPTSSAYDTSEASNKMVKVRRNIVLDADDQRMQLAMALYEPPTRLSNGICVSLCLLSMEEDEAADSGFPVFLTNKEDEHFICTSENRFRTSPLQVEMTDENGANAPVARVIPEIMLPGVLEFMFDSNSCASHQEAMALRFRHEDTGATLELDLSLLKTGASGGSFVAMEQREQQQSVRQWPPSRRSMTMVMDEMDKDDDEGENLDDFEDDGFVVDEEEESDVEGSFSGDESEICCICRDGGELMVCDGGKEMDGCGRSFHCQCVGRPDIPDGDWICSDCAKSGGILVEGRGGHEFVARSLFAGPKQMDNGASVGASIPGRILDEDTSDEEKSKSHKEATTERPNSIASGIKGNKRRTIFLDDTSDDE